jgi:hypothetical protein
MSCDGDSIESPSREQARKIAQIGKDLDYEQEALDAAERFWLIEHSEYRLMAINNARFWASMHLARVTEQAAGPRKIISAPDNPE